MSGGKDQGGMAMEVAGQAVEVFKKPLQPAPHRKKKVLDEETYVRVSVRLTTTLALPLNYNGQFDIVLILYHIQLFFSF